MSISGTALTLKVRVNNVVKAMRFPEHITVHEACKTIAEKTGEGGKDHGLYKPLNENSGIKGGRWLRPERTLEYYSLSTNVWNRGTANMTDVTSGSCRVSQEARNSESQACGWNTQVRTLRLESYGWRGC